MVREIPIKASLLLRIVALALLLTKLNPKRAESYKPKRVIRQLCYDKGAVMFTSDMGNLDVPNVEA